MRIQYTFISKIFLFLLTLPVLSFSCNNEQPGSPLLGRYILQIDDSLKNPYFLQDAELILAGDNKIIYNSKINNKTKFHFTGAYLLDEKTNSLAIKWKDGKLPNQLYIEQKKGDYLIQIGDSRYLKEK